MALLSPKQYREAGKEVDRRNKKWMETVLRLFRRRPTPKGCLKAVCGADGPLFHKEPH